MSNAADSIDLTPAGLTEAHLRETRTSVKWSTYGPDVLPLFIAEMDFPTAPEIQRALIEQIERSDLGYTSSALEPATAFAEFASRRWDWSPDPAHFIPATDVSFGVIEALRHSIPAGGRIALTTPVYPSFFDYLQKLGFECVEIPLIGEGPRARIDIDALEAAFAGVGQPRVHGLVLSNPHNPHGIAHERAELERLAQIAAQTGAFVVSDEIHAPLVHSGVVFTPFAPLAARAGAASVTVTSASKGWNLAGTKYAITYAPPETTTPELRAHLKRTLGFSGSILGRTACTVAFRECDDWLDAAIRRVEANAQLLAELLEQHVPGAVYTRPRTGYLAWVDLREAGFGDDPFTEILNGAKVALGNGAMFGQAGRGFVRVNLGCTPELLREAVERIGALTSS